MQFEGWTDLLQWYHLTGKIAAIKTTIFWVLAEQASSGWEVSIVRVDHLCSQSQKFVHMRLCSPQHCQSLETVLSPQCKGNNSRGVLKTVFHALWQAPYTLAGFTITALCAGDWIVFILPLIKAKQKMRNKPTITLLLGGSVRIKMNGQPPSHGSEYWDMLSQRGKGRKGKRGSWSSCRNHPANQG